MDGSTGVVTRARAREQQEIAKQSPEYAVILPTYNERENLPVLIWILMEAFHRNGMSYEVIVVDDGSPDGTADVFRKIQKSFPDENFVLLTRPGKLGLGTAYIHALSHVRGKFVILMDADLSHHPQYIADFIAKQKEGNFDIVSGSRYIAQGGVAGWDFRRILMSRCANFMAQLLLNPKASDLTGSFRLYKKEVLESIVSEMNAKGYVFQMEILVRAKARGFTVGEVPIIFVDRFYGESKLGAGEITSYIKGLLYLFWTL